MSVDMNKTIEQASLNNLHDIMTPEAVGFFPLAVGWYVLIALVMALLFHFGIQKYKEYKNSQYKREALKELESYTKSSKKETISLLSLAKRVGIVAYGRKSMAKLSNDSWWNFMEEKSTVKVDGTLRESLSKLLYDASYTVDTKLFEQIKALVTLWITTHKRSKDV